MPQFEKITFFNQVFWLLFAFLTFYLVLLKFFLSKIGAVLKLRRKMLKRLVYDGWIRELHQCRILIEAQDHELYSYYKNSSDSLEEKSVMYQNTSKISIKVLKGVFLII